MTRTDLRRAVTLIELVVVIGVGSVVFGLAVILLAATLRTERTSRKHLSETTTVGRLASQFRADVHAATSAEMKTVTAERYRGVRLSDGDGTHVDYQWANSVLARTKSVNNKVESRELFQLPSLESISFESEEISGRSVVTLALHSRPSELAGRLGRNLRIEAALGKTMQVHVSSPP